MRLVGYVGVLTGDLRPGIREQEAVLTTWAEGEGHRLVAIAHDLPRTGQGDPARRPGLRRALLAIADRRVGGLVVRDLGVIALGPTVQEAVLALVWQHGGQVFTVGGRIDPGVAPDPVRGALRETLNTFRQLDRGVRLARVQARRRRATDRGDHPGGAPAYGFRVDARRLAEDPIEQAAISRIVELRRRGESLRAIGLALDAEGYRPKRSERWHPESIRRILARLGPLPAPGPLSASLD